MTQPIDLSSLTSRQRELLHDLTPAQQEAVTHVEGPLLVLAGAGSGKTRVITRRVAYLLDQGISPYRILAITFTNKAAGEMRQRVESLVPNSPVLISTFHALGARLLRQYADRLGLDRNFTIYDQNDRIRVVKIAMEDAGLDTGRLRPETVQSAISKAKNQLTSPEKFASRANDFFAEAVAQIYPAYEKRLRDCSALDFDDLLYWPALALKNDQELRAELDQRFRFVLIDEYQDTNHAQYALAQNLNVDEQNLYVVGDPDQSIYGWRGSDIRNILNFERDFPDAKVLTLKQNYRSTQPILHAASVLISNNQNRKPKDLITDKSEGLPVRVLTFETSRDEAEGVVRRIREAVENDENRRYRDVAIFFRVNALSRTFEQAFIRQRVPYQIVRGLAFFERKENRDVLAYLRVLINPKDNISFERAVNEPARGIGKVSLAHLRAYAERNELSLMEATHRYEKIDAIKGKAKKGLRDFSILMTELSPLVEDVSPDMVVEEVLRKSGYRTMLKDSSDEDDAERLANVEELITAARQFAEEDEERTIVDFLESITLASDVDGWDEQQDCVSVMTLHASKGLEFPVVYLAALENGILPHERSLDPNKPEQLEEERRLCFVGMTRAKEELFLSNVRMREYRGQTLYAIPSKFVSELPPEVEQIDASAGAFGRRASMDQWRTGSEAAVEAWADAGVSASAESKAAKGDYVAGMMVRHERHGVGRIIDVTGQGVLRRVRIRFQKAGERTLLVHKVKLEILPDEES